MAYARKTRDRFDVEQHAHPAHGWECVCSEATRKQAKERLREYRENQPEFPVRIVKRREPIEGA